MLPGQPNLDDNVQNPYVTLSGFEYWWPDRQKIGTTVTGAFLTLLYPRRSTFRVVRDGELDERPTKGSGTQCH